MLWKLPISNTHDVWISNKYHSECNLISRTHLSGHSWAHQFSQMGIHLRFKKCIPSCGLDPTHGLHSLCPWSTLPLELALPFAQGQHFSMRPCTNGSASATGNVLHRRDDLVHMELVYGIQVCVN